MRRYLSFPFMSLVYMLAASPIVQAQDFNGTFLLSGPEGNIQVILEQSAAGRVSGVMSDGSTAMQMQGETDSSGISGDVISDQDVEFGFVGQLESDNTLYLTLFPYDQFGNPDVTVAQSLILARQVRAAGGSSSQAQSGGSVSAAAATASREVYINRVRLDDQTVQEMETQYQIPIQNGRYWYDVNCGAWGIEGGPTAGFIYPGLNLPGPMPTDISAGGTNIFINGREIHPQDQYALQQIFGYTIPGRYWLDAQGNLGPEGGMAITNLAVAMQAAQSGGQSGSVTSGYGQAGGSRGTVGGGMYSGVSATGKSVLWFPGM